MPVRLGLSDNDTGVLVGPAASLVANGQVSMNGFSGGYLDLLVETRVGQAGKQRQHYDGDGGHGEKPRVGGDVFDETVQHFWSKNDL